VTIPPAERHHGRQLHGRSDGRPPPVAGWLRGFGSAAPPHGPQRAVQVQRPAFATMPWKYPPAGQRLAATFAATSP
jgi:hypothetical protein